MGNPYSAALIWNTAGWMLDGYADIAKVWNWDTKSYIDIFPGDIIPATNGFIGFGQSVGAPVHIQMGIPASARVISQTPFYKSAGQEGLYLSVREKNGKAAQECNIVKQAQASNSFNMQCDSYFNAGYAPQFYAINAEKALSTYAVLDLDDHEIELGFVKNDSDEFELFFNVQKSVNNQIVLLTDLKTGVTQNLSLNPVYSFSSEASDEPKRFILKSGTLGQNEEEISKEPEIRGYGQQIYISGAMPGTLLQVLDISGRLITELNIENGELFSCNPGLPSGVYIIRVVGKGYIKSVKIVLI